jgi:hypothetical protein
MVSYTKISPNKTSPRRDTIKKITIHHTAGTYGLYTLGRIFANPDRDASSNYGISSDGKVGMYVEEKDRAWTSSSPLNDHQAITIEVSNSAIGYPWPVSDSAYKKLIELCIDICQRNGIKKLVYTGDANGNLTEHRMFHATTCPGQYLHSRMGMIADAVNQVICAEPYKGVFPKPTVSRTQGSVLDIKLWQKYLCWYGADVAVDGKFGPDTYAKTVTFQKENGLVPDGSAGPLTIAKAKTIKK